MEKEVCHVSRSNGGEDTEEFNRFYLNVEAENREDPRKYYKCHFPALWYPRQKEMVATDMVFQA
eukprot:30706-Ditylum_brightwellii.AAC.1